MEFYIKKNATLPLLKMQVVRDGRSEYQTFVDSLGDATIFFTMINEASGIPKIVSKPAYITEVVNDDPNALPEYYVYFRFTERDTNTPGRYQGQFLIQSDKPCANQSVEIGTLILPIREELYINVQDSFISKSPCC
jgi:hypothetical protein